MKVYYNLPEVIPAKSEVIATITQYLPSDMAPIVTTIFEQYNDLKENYAASHFEKIKYQTMWALRSLETEINEENGMIVIESTGRIATKQFSPELTEKIKEALEKNIK